MSLLDALRAGIKVADKVTKPLQATVSYQLATTNIGYDVAHSTAVSLRAIVDFAKDQDRTKDGIVTPVRVTLTLLDIKAIVDATGGEGIGPNDIFTLPDGSTGPILGVDGFIDAGTGHPIATTVRLG